MVEWNVLTASVGGPSTGGKFLKATSGWNSYNGNSGNGTDFYGFTALPGGSGGSGGDFGGVGDYSDLWSASEDNTYNAYYRCMHYDYADRLNNDKSVLRSVSCLKNYPE